MAWFALLVSLLSSPLIGSAQNWPSFRGPNGSGIGDGDPPVTWDLVKGSNVVWAVELEGLANSSPIIWGDWIFVTTAISSTPNPKFEADPTWGFGTVDGGEPWTWKVICLDKNTGMRVWEKIAHIGVPKQKLPAGPARCAGAENGADRSQRLWVWCQLPVEIRRRDRAAIHDLGGVGGVESTINEPFEQTRYPPEGHVHDGLLAVPIYEESDRDGSLARQILSEKATVMAMMVTACPHSS
jgi:hypothetical protein